MTARGWLSRLWQRRPVAPLPGAERIREILEAYGACLERRGPGRLHARERDLPHSKETIGRAILVALRHSVGPETTTPLRNGFVDLERFLGDDEWPIVEEYERRATSTDAAELGGMAPDRREAALSVLKRVDERRARRLELLAILEREATQGR